MKKSHKYDYAITGNCNYLAYIKSDSSLEWMCWPRMDSSFIFGGMIDQDKGGSFKVVPKLEFTTTQSYIENPCIVVTQFCCEYG